MGKSLKEKFESSAIEVMYRRLAGKNGDFPESVSVLGMDVTVRTRLAINLGLRLGKKDVRIYTQEIPGAMEIDALDCYLAGMAAVYAREFYDKKNKKREMVVVRGKRSGSRDKFMYHLGGLVDVFVESEEQCQADLGFVIDFEDPF